MSMLRRIAMSPLWTLFILIFLSSTAYSLFTFSCQGLSLNSALARCPDGGVQRASNGGNVTIFVRRGVHLPNRDFTGPSAKVSDPYVKFSTGSVTAQTRPIANNLNPVWNEAVNLGLLLSGTEITVEVWDHDIGLEFADDLLVHTKIRVPFCSTFYANETEVDCGKPFGCSSDDSLWKMPKRQMCNESGPIRFVADRKCSSEFGICVFVDILIVPFTMQVEVEYKNALLRTPILSAAAPISPQAPWTYSFGYPFDGDTSTVLNMNAIQSSQLKGALMLRMYAKDKAKGAAGEVKFYASVNFPAYYYVCREKKDNGEGIPDWLLTEFTARNRSINQLLVKSSDVVFECFYLATEGTVKNKYGGVMSGAVAFRTNTLPGRDSFPFDQSLYRFMYIVLAVPRVVVPIEEVIQIVYDASIFLNSIASYGFICGWFIFIVAKFMRRINYRVDRISTFLTTRVLSGDDKTILAALFMTYAQSPCNIEFRAHLYHAENVINFIIAIPFFLLLGWGGVCAASLRPVSLGYAIIFMGTSSLLFWFGFRLWENSNWRMSPNSLVSLGGAVFFFLVFILSVIFVDPAVLSYGYKLNFAALSLVFGTLNCMPLLLLVFKQDKTYKSNLKIVIDKIGEAVLAARDGPTKTLKKNDLKANKLLHALLGDMYTLNPNIPIFKFATVLSELPKEASISLGKLAEGLDVKHSDDLYNTSLFLLLVYIFIAIARSGYPSLAFLNCLALMLFDAIHTGVANGDINWSPGYKIALLVFGRLLVMGSGPTVWLLNYSAAYLMYSVALMREIINEHLPILSARQASEIVFTMKEEVKVRSPDSAGSPYFCLGWLTFAFLSIIFVAAFAGEGDALPVAPIDVFGSPWPVFSFGVIAFLLLVTGSLMSATVRAMYLKKHGLLKDWAKKIYMFNPKIDLVMILGIFSEISILTSGILIYGVTKANFVLIVAVFVPIILASLGHCFRVWVSNDFVLVHWPPKDTKKDVHGESPNDLQITFNMIENLFGNNEQHEEGHHDDDTPQEKTLKGFKLPALEATGSKIESEVKMPPLPLKSVLRKKRQSLGIQIKKPLVKDFKARDDGDADKFGSGDVIDLNDPWAQFEEDEEVARRPKKKQGIRFHLEDRAGFMEHPYVIAAKNFVDNNKYCQIIIKLFSACFRFCWNRINKYQKVAMYKLTGKSDKMTEEEEKQRLAEIEAEKFNGVTFWQAVYMGFLNKDEYIALASWFFGMFMIMMMGVAIADNNDPAWIGHVFWVSIWMFICTFIPVYKYYHTFVFDKSMYTMAKFVAFFHFMFCVCFFGAQLHGDIGLAGSLWILDYFFYYPAFLYLMFEFYRWCDDGFKLEVLDKDGDGNITIAEYIQFFKAYPILLAMMIILNWQFYLWISYLIGQVTTILLLVVAVGYIFVRDWAANDFFLSPEFSMVASYIVNITLLVSFSVAFFQNANPIFALSVFFLTYILKLSTTVATRIMIADPETLIFFSPTIMPVYSYDPEKNDLVDESFIAITILKILILGGLWGASMAMFLYPVNVGIAVACIFLLVIVAIVSAGMTYLPMQLGKYSSMLSADAIIEAASAAKSKFFDRKQPLEMEIQDWDRDTNVKVVELVKSTLDREKERTAIALAHDIITSTRSLSYVPDDTAQSVAQVAVELADEDKDEIILPWYMTYWNKAKVAMDKLFAMIPGNRKGWKKHSESMFNFTDAMAEAIIAGRGPYGFFGLEGQWFKLFQEAKQQPRLKFLEQPWLNAYDDRGNNKRRQLLSERLESKAILDKMVEYDTALDHVFREEFRCAAHFLLMMIVSSDAKMQRERVLFQKFLRENRFKLQSNGITPPSEIFSSSSYASINIPLTAVWLTTLSPEEKERFQLLKGTFSDEQRNRDDAIDSADYEYLYEANRLKESRVDREIEYAEKLKRGLVKKLHERVNAFVNTLDAMDKAKFQIRREVWLNNPDCFVDQREKALHERFRAACFMENVDEFTEIARQELEDIEAAQVDCRMGEYGRTYQFVDSEFPPNDVSVGEIENKGAVLGFRCAPGILEGVSLFYGGTDPDDITQGVFRDQWLLSALSMLAAAGGVGDGLVDAQIKHMFIGRVVGGTNMAEAMQAAENSNNNNNNHHHHHHHIETTTDTQIGAYCIRLFKQGFWNPVIIDDLLPMKRKEYWNSTNFGMACAYAKGGNGFWVSLIEKAFAKYYGSYAALERGFVHHALEDMTGCESECLMLSYASRGVGKRSLWNTLIRYRKNGYIIGAGTGDSSLVDKEIQNMGIVFNAAYTIYDILTVDGNKLIKLRNPPGDHDEWKGDWSDKSDLWTKRLKAKCGLVDADDNTFYISFDDFCNVFRNLFVCKWYDPSRWEATTFPATWKKSDEAELDRENMMKQMMMNEIGIEAQVDVEAEERKKAKARLDTSGGLPTKHNPNCNISNNPQFSLKIHRPTEVKITVTQTDSHGKVCDTAIPFAIFIVKNEHQTVPMRVKNLHKDNVLFYTGEPKALKSQNLYARLDPGLYIVMIPPYVAGMTGHFTITLVYNHRNEFIPLWPPKWLMKGEKGKVPSDLGSLATNKNDDGSLSAKKSASQDMVKTVKKGFKNLFGISLGESDGSSSEEDDDDDDKKNNDDV